MSSDPSRRESIPPPSIESQNPYKSLFSNARFHLSPGSVVQSTPPNPFWPRRGEKREHDFTGDYSPQYSSYTKRRRTRKKETAEEEVVVFDQTPPPSTSIRSQNSHPQAKYRFEKPFPKANPTPSKRTTQGPPASTHSVASTSAKTPTIATTHTRYQPRNSLPKTTPTPPQVASQPNHRPIEQSVVQASPSISTSRPISFPFRKKAAQESKAPDPSPSASASAKVRANSRLVAHTAPPKPPSFVYGATSKSPASIQPPQPAPTSFVYGATSKTPALPTTSSIQPPRPATTNTNASFSTPQGHRSLPVKQVETAVSGVQRPVPTPPKPLQPAPKPVALASSVTSKTPAASSIQAPQPATTTANAPVSTPQGHRLLPVKQAETPLSTATGVQRPAQAPLTPTQETKSPDPLSATVQTKPLPAPVQLSKSKLPPTPQPAPKPIAHAPGTPAPPTTDKQAETPVATSQRPAPPDPIPTIQAAAPIFTDNSKTTQTPKPLPVKPAETPLPKFAETAAAPETQVEPSTPAKLASTPQSQSVASNASSSTAASSSRSTPTSMSMSMSTDGVGLSSAKLSHNRRRMLDLVNKLHSTGVQVDIDLPQIAVIGSQSAGKSSLIESISGITLPRAAGTCTRCPIECRLSSSDAPWQCIVSLRFITDANGQPLGQARNQSFGDVIYDKEQVEERIRRAQRAVLNPTIAPPFFLSCGLDDVVEGDKEQLSFSNNCVSLQISGPDVADLSFCDLPGLIASVSSGGGGNDIALVENLVTSYIKKPSCIVLLTVACETDFENQGAHRLAKEYDPEGKRTIGVLTKPDRIPTGEEGSWLPFLRNEKEPLENNWFCVKQPSSNDLKKKMTWAQARKAEDDYFSMTPHWRELDSVYQKYLRTSNLVERLSLVLSDLISKRLPQIYDELDRTIQATRKALFSLPRAPSGNPQGEISSMLHNFVTDLEKHIEGVPDEDGLLQAIRPAHDRFRRSIRETAPNFRPFERAYEGKRHLRKATFLVQEEGRAWEGEDSEAEADAEEADDEEAPTSEGDSSGRPLKRKRVSSNKIFIDDVSARANRARTRELPGHYPFIVQQTFIENIIKEWKEPAITLSKTVNNEISEHVKKLVRKHFHDFGQGQLEQRVKNIMNRHIQDCMASTERMIGWLLVVEERPFSLNTHYLSDYKEKFLAFYKEERQRYTRKGGDDGPLLSTQGENLNEALAALAKLGLAGITQEDLWKLLPSDEMEPALTIMADVRAYFQVAYKRFADNLPLAIDHELVRGVGRDVLKVLYDKLGINGPDSHEICRELAQESAQVADKRADLNKKLERLEFAQKELLVIGA